MRREFGIFVIISFMGLVINQSGAQLNPDEIPPELKYILKTDVPEWEPPEELSKKLPYYLSGFDYENRPIWIMEFGKWDIRYFVEKGEKWEKLVDKYFDKFLYRLYNSTWIKATEELPVKDGVLIVDFEALSLRQLSSPPALGFFINKFRTIVSALPLCHDGIGINVNFVARNLIELVRPIIGPEFYKLEIFGTNPQKYKVALLKLLPPDQIPEWYGGSKGFKPVAIYGRNNNGTHHQSITSWINSRSPRFSLAENSKCDFSVHIFSFRTPRDSLPEKCINIFL